VHIADLDFFPFKRLPDQGELVAFEDDCDAPLAIVRYSYQYSQGERSHLCGYVCFESKAIPSSWVNDYNADALQYLMIHGGLTYARGHKRNRYAVFGFDCAHAGDDANEKLRDPVHVLELAKQMRALMRQYASVIDVWRSASRMAQADMIDAINKNAKIHCEVGFGALIDLMFGGARTFHGPQTQDEPPKNPAKTDLRRRS